MRANQKEAPAKGRDALAAWRSEVCSAGRRLHELGFIPASAGNLSVRLDDGRILVTPSGAEKGALVPADLILLKWEGCSGAPGPGQETAVRNCQGHRVSSEVRMHLRIYAMRPDVRAVCHSHPPVATGFAAAGRALERAMLGEMAVLLGAVPLAPYGEPGTDELADSIAPFIPCTNAILLANHGVVTFGENLRTALQRMELVEHCARVALVADLLGGAKLLSRAQVDALVAARERYGIALPVGAPPLRAAEDEEPDV